MYILTVIWASRHLKDFGYSMILLLRKSQPLSPRPCFAHSRHSQSPLLWFTPCTFLSTQSSLRFQLHYKREWRQEPPTSKIRMTWTFPFAKSLFHHKHKLLLPQPSPYMSWLNVNPDTVPWKPAGNVKALMLSSPCGWVFSIQCLGPTGAFWNRQQQLNSWVFRTSQL